MRAAVETPYTLRDLVPMLGLSRGAIAGLVSAGYVRPTRGARNEFRFSFQDVVLLRTALELRAAQIPPRTLMRALRQLDRQLPAEVPRSGLRIRAIGSEVAVRDGDAHWEAETGQFLFDFGIAASGGTIAFLKGPADSAPQVASASAWFAKGELLEAKDPAAAEAAYRQALEIEPELVEAYVNLGALLCEAGRCQEAVELYERAVLQVPDAPLVRFNAAIALEDQHREADALRSYERCLKLAPDLADAHFNAARLCEKLGDSRGALRHFSAYRRLNP